MNLTEFLEKWGRTLFEAPLAGTPNPEEPPELAEIRLAVLDQIREKSYRSGGMKVFPYDLLRVRLRGVEEGRGVVYAGRFFRKYLEQEVRSALVHSACRYPESLRVEVQIAHGLPQRGEDWLQVETGSQEQAGGSLAAARLVVRLGEANVAEIPLNKARTNIGRATDVMRSEGLHRRNDLVFAAETEVNRHRRPLRRYGHRFPELRAVPLADRSRQCPGAAQSARRAPDAAHEKQLAHPGFGGARRLRGRLSQGIIGRHETARRICAGAGG
jgi:hypothetical protein